MWTLIPYSLAIPSSALFLRPWWLLLVSNFVRPAFPRASLESTCLPPLLLSMWAVFVTLLCRSSGGKQSTQLRQALMLSSTVLYCLVIKFTVALAEICKQIMAGGSYGDNRHAGGGLLPGTHVIHGEPFIRWNSRNKSVCTGFLWNYRSSLVFLKLQINDGALLGKRSAGREGFPPPHPPVSDIQYVLWQPYSGYILQHYLFLGYQSLAHGGSNTLYTMYYYLKMLRTH